MLNVMRDNLKHLKWVLWPVIVSFVLYLGYGFFGNDGGPSGETEGWAVRVDGDPISLGALRAEARRRDQAYRSMFGEQFEQLKGQIHVGREAAEWLVLRKLMLEEARDLGLAATPKEIADRIQRDPSFKDPVTGQFVGKERYAQAVQRGWEGGISGYEQYMAEEIAIEKWKNLVTEPAVVSDLDLEKVYRQRNEKVQLDYVVVPSASQSFEETVSDEQARSWYASHQDAYRRGESRRIRYLLVDRQAQAAKLTIPDPQVRAFFDENQATFTLPEQRHARHILFRVETGAPDAEVDAARVKAEVALERARRGEDFATLAGSLSQDPGSAAAGGDLGWFERGKMVPAFENAAFNTAVGQLASLTRSEFGWHVIQVTDSRPAGPRPFDEVKEDIRRQLQVQGAQKKVQEEAERIRAKIDSPESLETVAKAEGVQVQETLVSAGDRLVELGPSPEFSQEVFRLAPGSISKPVGVAQGLAIVAVREVVPASVRPLPEVMNRVKTDLLNDRARKAAVAAARSALERGADLESIARNLGGEVKSSGDLAPGQALPGAGGPLPELERAVFQTGTVVGKTGVVETPAGAMVYSVTRYEPFEAGRFETAKPQLRDELLSQRRLTLLEAILKQLQTKHEIEMNQEMIEQIRS